ncbi:MAG: LuxR C-terminal-related transcriptional regulator [Cyclobacteriaceae bacterium]|nr:LuxR C-terminal-related transcriptional regulator [Cyclobacteriaceae bacterium]
MFEEEKNNLLLTFNNFLTNYREVQPLQGNYEMFVKDINFASQLVYVYDYANKEIIFSRGFDRFLEIEAPLKTAIDLYALVHPEDLKGLLIAAKVSMLVADTLPLANVGSAKLFIDYRLRKKSGEYIRILRQSSVLEVSEHAGMISSLSICTDISHIKKDGSVQARWEGQGQDLFDQMVYEEMAKADDIYSNNDLVVSKRENELIHLLGKGMTSQEIANKLFISVHTVNTHRRNILKKFDVRSITEVLMRVYG